MILCVEIIRNIDMDKVLVTGFNGFLGSHIVEFLINKGIEVYGIGNGPKIHGVNKISNDIITANKIPKEISCIIHLAALTDINYCQSNPKKCLETNVIGTLNMLELARKNNSKFIFSNSGRIFGKPSRLPIDENAKIHPLSLYDVSKSLGETICKSYAQKYGLDVCTLRFFSVYGPKSPQYSVINKIITQILTKDKIVLGDLSPKRDFLYVLDCVRAINLVRKRKLHGFQKFNVGTGKSFSIRNLCNKLIKISNKKITVESNKKFHRKSEIPNLVCDNKKLRKLSWKPKFDLDKGLKLTFDWFKKNQNSSVSN